MKVVIVGAWQRNLSSDDMLVDKLLDSLKSKYPKLHVITRGTDRGIGKLVKNRCMPQVQGRSHGEFEFAEIVWRMYLDEPTKAEIAQYWLSVNDSLVAIGEEFHIFVTDKVVASDSISDLVDKIVKAGLPIAVYKPGVNDAIEAEVQR